MRPYRFPAFIFFLCVIFAVSVGSAEVNFSLGWKTTISSITPGHIQAGSTASVIVSGAHLKSVKGCTVQPVTAAATAAKYDGCTAKPNKAGTQLILVIDKGLIANPGKYLVMLLNDSVTAATPDADYQKATLLASRAIIVDPAGSTATPAKSPGSGSDSVHPYTDCLSDASSVDGKIGDSTVPATGVLCSASVVPYGEVSDEFGYHVSNTYSAIQVRVSNKNSQYDFLLRDIVLTLPDGRIVSGRIRRFAQGVAVKGKTHDRRSMVFNSLTAVGGTYGALASFGSAGFTTAGNVFQGAFLASFNQVFPDYTADNVNRFNNSVFDDQNPSIVPKDSIGQPPLYVIALVPKEPGTDRMTAYEDAKNIQVSIEGTFIKQVTLLSLSSPAAFKPQFVSPTSVFTPQLGFDFGPLRSASEEQQVTISNTGSTSMSIHGFSIVPTGKTVTGDSPDFEVDASKSSCGLSGANTTASNGKTAFTIAPNSSCFVMVQFHPTTAGQITASLNVDGDNLEGPTSVKLSGTGVGLVLQIKDASAPKPLTHTLTCSYSANAPCPLDIGLETPGQNATINAYYFTDTAGGSLVASITSQPDTAITSSGQVSNTLGTATSIKVPIPASGNAVVTMSLTDSGNPLFSKAFVIALSYSTIQTTISSPGSLSVPFGSATPTSLNISTSPLPPGTVFAAGQLTYVITQSGTKVKSGTVPFDNAGNATLSFADLQQGSYVVTVSYAENGAFAGSSVNFPLTITAPPPATVTFGAMPAATSANSATIPVNVTGAAGAVCTGTITAAIVPTTFTGLSVNGLTSISFTPANRGTYTITASFNADPKSPCGSATSAASPLAVN